MEIGSENGVLSVTGPDWRTMFLSMKFPSFKPQRWLSRWVVLGLMSCTLTGQAQDRVEVAQVNFSQVRAPGATADHWQEFAIELQAKPDRTNLGPVTARVKVSAFLGYERLLAGGKRDWQFFRATVELVGLDNGRSIVRFYLPPEILKRDSVRGVPKYWAVQLAGDEIEMEALHRSYSVALTDDKIRDQFMSKALNEGAMNDGLLQPQHLTPFAMLNPNSTPTVVRPESWQ